MSTPATESKTIYRQLCAEGKVYVPIFQQAWWMDAVAENWEVALARKGEHITGAWPYTVEKRLGISFLRNPKLTPYAGPVVFFPADLKESNRDGFEHEAIGQLLEQLPKAKEWTLSLQPGIHQAGLIKNNGLESTVRQTFLLDLSADTAIIFKGFKESLRRNLTTAAEEYIVTNEPPALKDLYAFHAKTLEGKGVQQGFSFQQASDLMEACLMHNSAALWAARKDGQVHAAVWQVWDARCSYYLMGSTNPGASGFKALSLLLWQAIRHAQGLGLKQFDFEGSMDAGVERFFRTFGGRRALYLVLKKETSFRWKMVQAVRKMKSLGGRK